MAASNITKERFKMRLRMSRKRRHWKGDIGKKLIKGRIRKDF